MVGVTAIAELPDRELVVRHAHGDPAAFDEIYARFSTLVYGIARRMSGDEAVAEDLSQEIFLRIFRHLRKFRGRATLKTWVYRVAVNCCRSRLGRRSRQRRPRVDVDEAFFEALPAERGSPDRRVRRREASEQLQRALAELPIAFREAVVLRDLCDLSYDEIATVLGVRIGTVRSRIARGRDRLRLALSDPAATADRGEVER